MTTRKRGTDDPVWNRVDLAQSYGIIVDAREIFMDGVPGGGGEEPGVEYEMASRLIRNLRLLSLDSAEPVLIHMKTCGGWVSEGLAIYDAINTCPCHITIISYTHARSMSGVILQAADKRLMMQHSYFLYHKGEWGFAGQPAAVISQVEYSKMEAKRILDIYIEALKDSEHGIYKDKTSKDLRAILTEQMQQKGDVFLPATVAVQQGFADAVISEPKHWKGIK